MIAHLSFAFIYKRNLSVPTDHQDIKHDYTMTAEKAADLYQKLSPFLRKVDPWGFYLPKKTNKSKNEEDWFLFDKPGFPIPLLAVTWNPNRKEGKNITFEDFLKVYNIKIVEY